MSSVVPGAGLTDDRRATSRVGIWLDSVAGYLLTAPALLIMLGLMLYPLLYAFYLSFMQWRPDESIWLGVDNYVRLAGDRLFWKTLGNTFFYTFWNVTAGTMLSLVMALLMNQPGAMARLFRLVVALPLIISAPIAALTWSWVLDTDFGLLNQSLLEAGLVDRAVPWLNSPFYARWSIVMVNIWLGTGLSALLLLAALQQIPKELLESATLDGAGVWQRFRHVTLPQLRPMLLVVLIIKLIGSFKTFDQVFIMTGGGPLYSSETILVYLYRHGFEYFDFGYASAVGVIFFVIVATLSAVQAMFMRDRRP